jgi:hypothetical protein
MLLALWRAGVGGKIPWRGHGGVCIRQLRLGGDCRCRYWLGVRGRGVEVLLPCVCQSSKHSESPVVDRHSGSGTGRGSHGKERTTEPLLLVVHNGRLHHDPTTVHGVGHRILCGMGAITVRRCLCLGWGEVPRTRIILKGWPRWLLEGCLILKRKIHSGISRNAIGVRDHDTTSVHGPSWR